MILIVDDIRDSADALARLLRRRGLPASVTTEPVEALGIVRGHPKDQPLMLILDEMMPAMTGTQLLETLREDPATAHVTVVMYSAGFDTAAREKAMALGAVAWIMKGGSGSDLMNLLQTIGDCYGRIGGKVRDGVGVKRIEGRG